MWMEKENMRTCNICNTDLPRMECGHYDAWDETLWPADVNGVIHEAEACRDTLLKQRDAAQADAIKYRNRKDDAYYNSP